MIAHNCRVCGNHTNGSTMKTYCSKCITKLSAHSNWSKQPPQPTPDAKEVKACNKCKVLKSFDCFSRNNGPNNRFRLRSICRDCDYQGYKKRRALNPSLARACASNWRRNNLEKKSAQATLRHHLLRNNIAKKPCAICSEVKAHAHHTDYNKPLDVTWLCVKHHNAWHRAFLPEQAITRIKERKP